MEKWHAIIWLFVLMGCIVLTGLIEVPHQLTDRYYKPEPPLIPTNDVILI